MTDAKTTTRLFQSILTAKKPVFPHLSKLLELDVIFSLLLKAETHMNVLIVNYQGIIFVKLTLIPLPLFQLHQLIYLDHSRHVLKNILVPQVT